MSFALGAVKMSQSLGERNVRTKNYKSLLDDLGKDVAKLAKAAFRAFLKNPHDPMLDWHDLKDKHRGQHRSHSFSVSVTYRYRAIYVVDGNTNVWYWIGTHESYNTFTGRK